MHVQTGVGLRLADNAHLQRGLKSVSWPTQSAEALLKPKNNAFRVHLLRTEKGILHFECMARITGIHIRLRSHLSAWRRKYNHIEAQKHIFIVLMEQEEQYNYLSIQYSICIIDSEPHVHIGELRERWRCLLQDFIWQTNHRGCNRISMEREGGGEF